MQKLKASLAQVQPLHKPPAQHHTTPLQSQKPSILGPRNEFPFVASSHVGAYSTSLLYACIFQEQDEEMGGGEASGSMEVQGFFRAPIK